MDSNQIYRSSHMKPFCLRSNSIDSFKLVCDLQFFLEFPNAKAIAERAFRKRIAGIKDGLFATALVCV